jgi:hypothetical protein
VATALIIGVLCWALFAFETPSSGFTESAHYQSFIQALPMLSSISDSEAYRHLLIIGSAAAVAVMGMEKIGFIWYLKKISLLALAGYVAGALLYLIIK